MKTSELIEQARRCNDEFSDCKGCPFKNAEGDCREALINALADGYEMAYDDLRFSPTCATCKFFEGVTTNNKSWVCEQCIINNQYRVPTNWQWRGEE